MHIRKEEKMSLSVNDVIVKKKKNPQIYHKHKNKQNTKATTTSSPNLTDLISEAIGHNVIHKSQCFSTY